MALVLAGGDPATSAYAVEPHSDGTVSVSIADPRDAAGTLRLGVAGGEVGACTQVDAPTP